jgi:hypothetical protein
MIQLSIEILNNGLAIQLAGESRAARPRFPCGGRVEPPPSGGQIRIRLFTDQWHEQGGFLLGENGDFDGKVYINKQRPRARLELTVVGADGKELLQHYATLA